MKKNRKSIIGFIMLIILIFPCYLKGQSEKDFISKYFKALPSGPVRNQFQKYRMTAVYINRDLYGAFTDKTRVTGEYTCGLENGMVRWNNVFISKSNIFNGTFPAGTKQEYVENMTYLPSSGMISGESFKDFPAGTDNIFVRNLIWDMMMIEDFAWKYSDSLELNRKYIPENLSGEFQMADIGTYDHSGIQICWTGISVLNNKLCAVIEYAAPDNIISLSMDQIKTKGTEQYWGTTWINLDNRQIEYAETYSGTIQEITVAGFDNKFISKTIREICVEKIQ